MEELWTKYNKKKFRECLELINSLPEPKTETENFLLENCKLVCESIITLKENDPDKVYKLQEQYFFFVERVISVGTITETIPFQLKLSAMFNFIFWILFYNDKELDDCEAEEYLQFIHKGLLTVLGNQITSGSSTNVSKKILKTLLDFKSIIFNVEYRTTLLVLELIVVVILYIMKLRRALLRDCLLIIDLFIKEAELANESSKSVNEFLQIEPIPLYLCKFTLNGNPSSLLEITSEIVDYLHLLKSVLLFLLEDFRESLKCLQTNLNSNFKRFLAKMSSLVLQKNLKARCLLFQGKLCSTERNYKEAVHHFKNALILNPNCPVAHYYIGQQYGKMGLFDLMIDNFENLIKCLKFEETENDFKANFETTLLDFIHPFDEISEPEAHYALAISYGLSENFSKGVEFFEKVMKSYKAHNSKKNRRIIELPHFLTILHEAAVMHLMLGNLVRAEQITLDAIDQYVLQEQPEKHDLTKSFMRKDVDWLQKVIHQDLLDIDLEPKELSNVTLYFEDIIYCFPQNIIALLILSEIQRIQGIEDYKVTLSRVFSMFSKYLVSVQKKDEINEEEKLRITLVKALAGKTCIKIANIQLKNSDCSNVEKMFKRALSCNKGDKDALHNYFNFFLKSEKEKEAVKLWHTFSKQDSIINIDSLQSFSLKYFLTDKITKRELEKVQQQIESVDFI